jgi:RNA polymerase sigma-70 factor (ECF subfamily)
MASPETPTWCEALYAAKAAELLLYGRALGLGHGEAEDVLHDVFRHLLELPAAPENPAHYAVRAFRNRALNHRRGLWRRLARELESARWFEPAPAAAEREAAAVRCLAGLPAEQREAIVLKLWHGLTFEAIGELTGASPHTAAGRYRYGLAKLRACLRGDGPRHDFNEASLPSHERTGEPGGAARVLAAAPALGAA